MLEGDTFEEVRKITETLEEMYEDDEIGLAYFRYADDLLFENNGFEMLGSGWVVCDTCGEMRAMRFKNIHLLEGKSCKEEVGLGDCKGTMRKLTWDDLKPVKKNNL